MDRTTATVTARPRLHAGERRAFAPLLAVAGLLCLVPLALLTYSTRRAAEKVVTDEVGRNVQTTAAVSATLVSEQLHGIAGLLESYAGRPALQALFASGPTGADPTKLLPLVDGLRASGGIEGVFVTDLDGRLTNAVPETPAIVGKDFTYRDWYRGLKSTGNTYVSEAYETALAGHPRVVAVATYVHNQQGGRTAILAVTYSLDTINATSKRMATAQGVGVTVTDQRGVVLAAPGRTAVTGLVRMDGDERVRRALAGESGVVRSGTSNGPVLSAYTPVSSLGWTVTAELPTRTVLAPINAVSRNLLVLSALVGLASLAALGLLMRALEQGRRMEAELREEEARTREIVEAANDGFVSMDLEGTIRDWNYAAEEMFGWPSAEVCGRRLSEVLVPPQHRDAHEDGLAKYRESGEGPVLGQRIEITALRRSGEEFPIELSIFATEAGGRSCFNAFIHDITKRHEEAAAIASARDQAMEASRLKSEFLANMSHEIRTPMNGVLGMTSLLLDSTLTKEQRAFAQSVMSSGEALLEIINDILDFSKMEAGKLDIETIDFDLRELVEGSIELLAPRAQEKGLEVAALIDPSLPHMVGGDPGRVRQVLTNLVGNAIKFTASGEVVVRATVIGDVGEQLSVRVTVSDTGIGMDAATAARMFEAFAQADSSTTRRYGGTGLGLAISKQLVELMGGAIGVDSRIGVGSTFWFEVPFARAKTPAVRRQPREDLCGLRVLVVDDNSTNREVVRQFLRSWSMEGEEAAGGTEALEVLRAAASSGMPFDVAVVDLNMPDVDGMELARCVGADPALASTRLVLLTSSAQRGEAADAYTAGFDGYLTKPVRQSHLLDTLATVMGAEGAEQSAPIVTRHLLPERERPRVLLAEDNDISQRVAVAMLQRIGYRVDVAGNGEEAIAAVGRGHYAAVLMDCQMPVLDGYEATKAIRAAEPNGIRIPIIALSASAMAGDADAAFAIGMDEYLTKPIAADELERTLARWAPIPSTLEGPPEVDPEARVGEQPEPADDAGGSAELPPLDPAKVQELEKVGGSDFLVQIIELFLANAPARLEELRAALASGQADAASRAAHSLRGSAANIGARTLSDMCAVAETSAQLGDLAKAADAAAAAAVELARVTAAGKRLGA